MNPNLAVEWREEQPTPVPITQPVYPLDRPEGRILDDVRCGSTLEAAIRREIISQVECREAEIRQEAISYTLAFIRGYKRPLLALDCLCFCVGEAQARGDTIVTIGRRHGVSKQAVQQCAGRIREGLGLRKVSTMQSEEAREHMSQANYRRKAA